LGFPGERPEDYQEMSDIVTLLTHLPEPSSVAKFRLERSSPYFECPEAYGLCNVRPLKVYSALFPELDPDVLFDLALFFDFDYVAQEDPKAYTHRWLCVAEKWKFPSSVGTMIAATRDDTTFILDRRFQKPGELTVLEGLESRVFDFCDEAHRANAVARHLREAESVVAAALDRLVGRGIVIRSDRQHLSLAIRVDRRLDESENGSGVTSALAVVADRMDSRMKRRREKGSRHAFKTTWAR